MIIALRVDVDAVIQAAGYELIRFDAAAPCARAVCDAVVGAPAADVDRTTVRAISELAALEPGSPIARAVHAALRGALRPWVAPTSRRGGEIVCACFALERDEVVATIRRHALRTVDEVREHLPATRGCGTCRPDIERLLRGEAASRDDDASEGVSIN